MKKFNWGTGIFIFYSLFAISLFYQVYKTTQYDRSLVVDNYYEEDLAYQSRFDQIKNSQDLAEKLIIQLNNEDKTISLHFPKDKKEIKGKVLLYRPSDKSMDRLLPIDLNSENEMRIATDNFATGRWKVKVEWEAGGQSYFDKRAIYISGSQTNG